METPKFPDGNYIVSKCANVNASPRGPQHYPWIVMIGLTLARAVPLLALLSLAACGEQTQKPVAQQAAPEVGVVTLKPREAKISTVLPGRVVAYQTSEVRPQVTGILLKRDFAEGAEVKEGDLLYEIDPVQYKAALASSEAAVQRAEATLVSVKLKAQRKTQLLQTNA